MADHIHAQCCGKLHKSFKGRVGNPLFTNKTLGGVDVEDETRQFVGQEACQKIFPMDLFVTYHPNRSLVIRTYHLGGSKADHLVQGILLFFRP